MSVTTFCKLLAGNVLPIILTACGGGGGASVASIPPPPAATLTPAPTPAPCSGAACLRAVNIFPAVTKTTDFGVLGLEANRGGLPASSLVRNGFSVQYNAEAGVYIFDVPSSAPGGFYENIGNTPNDRFWNGEIAEAPANLSIQASVYQPRPTNPEIQLTYTTYAMYGDHVNQAQPFGFVPFGTVTPQGSVPVTGGATYSAVVRGGTLDPGFFIRGSATLSFDFGGGTLTGRFDPTISSYGGLGEQLGLGRYDFVSTVFGVGSTSFSGALSKTGLAGTGGFDGLFTGPQAQELMARWTAPYSNPLTNVNSEMFGVWVGRKQ